MCKDATDTVCICTLEVFFTRMRYINLHLTLTFDICCRSIATMSALPVPKTKARWFRIYSADRKVRKPIGANTLEELLFEGMHVNDSLQFAEVLVSSYRDLTSDCCLNCRLI